MEQNKLRIVSVDTPGAKLIKYAEIPEFDQECEAVFEKTPADKGEYIFIDVEIREVEQEDEQSEEMF